MTDALNKLIEAVEAGTLTEKHALSNGNVLPMCASTWGAYNGSLDAAKALHEALLPGWVVSLHQTDDECIVNIRPKDGIQITESEFGSLLSRVWLLAILKANLAQEEDAELLEARASGPFVKVTLDEL